MVDGMMSSAFAAAHHVDSLSRMTSMANSISPPHPHTSPGNHFFKYIETARWKISQIIVDCVCTSLLHFKTFRYVMREEKTRK